MSWLERLENRLGSWTVPQFPLFIVAANALIYVLGITEPGFYLRLMLDTDAVRAGEFWRILTFLFIPPFGGPYGHSGLTPVWMVFWLLLLYQYTSALESEWGEFRFQLYYALGTLATIAVALLWDVGVTNLWLNTSLFLAFATLFPNFELLLFFIVPTKIKYIALLTWILIGWKLIHGTLSDRAEIAAALFNYVVFFGKDGWMRVRQIIRKRQFEKQQETNKLV